MICSATQTGFRVRRSKAEVVDGVGWRSFTGPGNPYWNRPDGFTGATRSLDGYCGMVRSGTCGTVGFGEGTVEAEIGAFLS